MGDEHPPAPRRGERNSTIKAQRPKELTEASLIQDKRRAYKDPTTPRFLMSSYDSFLFDLLKHEIE